MTFNPIPMKTVNCKSRLLFIACMFFLQAVLAQTSGRVVINEYMPWTSNGCGTTSEFIELLNFGPGPIDIGCYVITTGTYSITIPPNTILYPGDYFVLAGQDYLPDNCANIDSVGRGVTADLNWNTCGCTNVPIPASGDGLMSDGGSANTPLVLFDPSLNVVDAVVRSLPAEPSSMINTSTVDGMCSQKSFNLGAIPVVYEQLGMSAGRGNSFARTVDGDCGWVKDPQQSANASNNRSGDVTDIRYTFSLINPMDCENQGGRVSIFVEHSNYASIFPMNFTFAIDKNADGIFDLDDDYTTYLDSTPPSIEVTNLPIGHYKITISSVMGCYLKSFEFTILECTPALPVRLESFTYTGTGNGKHSLGWKINGAQSLQKIVVQKAKQGQAFENDKTISVGAASSQTFKTEITNDGHRLFRLQMVTKEGRAFYSPIISAPLGIASTKVWPNPANDILHLQLPLVTTPGMYSYVFFNSSGSVSYKGQLTLKKNQSSYSIPVGHLSPGIYQLQFIDVVANTQPIPFRFVKH